MTKAEVKKRIADAVKQLNAMDNQVVFAFEEKEESVGLVCKSRNSESRRFGAYCFTAFLDDYKKKQDAYEYCMQFAEVIIAATKLNDPKAYHNMC